MNRPRPAQDDIEATADRRMRFRGMDGEGADDVFQALLLEAFHKESAALACALDLRLDAKERGQY